MLARWITYFQRLGASFNEDKIYIYGEFVKISVIPTLRLEELVGVENTLVVGLDIFPSADKIIVGKWRSLYITIFQLTLEFYKKEDLISLWSEIQNENQWQPEKKRKKRIPSIPTFGERNLKFRSQLEAGWARRFTNWKWDWHYEPFPLKGYLPDFIICGLKEDILVEIKPCIEVRNLHKHKKKILKSGWKDWILILGKNEKCCLFGKIDVKFKSVTLSEKVIE